MDIERFHELAGFFEYDEGETRFRAEELAAQRLGVHRWEAINAISKRNSQGGGDIRQASERQSTGDLSRMQPPPKEEGGPLPIGDVQAGRDRMALLALPIQRGAVL